MRAPWLALILTLAGAGGATGASAQELNYQTFLVGERALGMGGAFTGVADDPSAAYYNPAGLAHIESSTLSGSLSVNAIHRYEVEDGYGSPIGTADLVHDGTPTVPLFVGVVKKFGPRDAERVRRHAIALSTVHPQSVNRRFEVIRTNERTAVHTSLVVSHQETTRWYGPSYAYRISPDFALGVSAFLATRELRHQEDEAIVTLNAADPSTNPTVFVRESIVDAEALGVVLRLGASWNATDEIRVGLMFQPPGISISSSSRVYERLIFADLMASPPGATFFVSDQGDLESEAPVPWELRLGARWSPSDAFMGALDVSIYGPVGSEEDPVHAIGAPDPEPPTGNTPQPGIFVVNDYRSELAFNVSLGMETIVAETVPIRAGVFTDLSAAPEVGGPTDVYAPAHVDGYGASLSVGITTEGYDLAIGAAALLGYGRGLRLNPQPGLDPTPQTYLPTDVETRSVYFFLSGAKRAASRLARNVYDEYIRPEDPQILE